MVRFMVGEDAGAARGIAAAPLGSLGSRLALFPTTAPALILGIRGPVFLSWEPPLILSWERPPLFLSRSGRCFSVCGNGLGPPRRRGAAANRRPIGDNQRSVRGHSRVPAHLWEVGVSLRGHSQSESQTRGRPLRDAQGRVDL